MNLMMRLFREEEGQGMTEYALIIAGVAVLLIGAIAIFKDDIEAVFTSVHTQMP